MTLGSAATEKLRAFVNTRDLEAGTDALASPQALADWLRDVGLLTEDPASASDDDVELAIRLREGLRDAWLAHHDATSGAAASAALAGVAEELQLTVDFTSDPPGFRPAYGGVRGALAQLLALVAVTVAEGSWDRLKVCSADSCRWAFFDASRNRSRTWCAMGVCGNRHKTKAYRARRRSTTWPGKAMSPDALLQKN